MFWYDGVINKARQWFQRIEKLDHSEDNSLGDFWAFYYRFELDHGNKVWQRNNIFIPLIAFLI